MKILWILISVSFFSSTFSSTVFGASDVNSMLKQAVKLENEGKFDEAIEVHKKIAAQFPKLEIAADATIAGLYGRENKFDEEIDWSKKAIQLDPKYNGGYINLGSGYAGKHDIPQAERAFLKAKEIDPRDPAVWYSLGALEDTKGHWSGAEKNYRESVKLNPKFESGWVNLGASLANQQKLTEAKAAFEKARALNPGAKDIKVMIDQVDASLKAQE